MIRRLLNLFRKPEPTPEEWARLRELCDALASLGGRAIEDDDLSEFAPADITLAERMGLVRFDFFTGVWLTEAGRKLAEREP